MHSHLSVADPVLGTWTESHTPPEEGLSQAEKLPAFL